MIDNSTAEVNQLWTAKKVFTKKPQIYVATRTIINRKG